MECAAVIKLLWYAHQTSTAYFKKSNTLRKPKNHEWLVIKEDFVWPYNPPHTHTHTLLYRNPQVGLRDEITIKLFYCLK